MTEVSPPPQDPNSGNSSRRLSRSFKTVLIIGGILAVGGATGAIAAQYFVYNRLAPLVETTLSNLLNRPVELGDVRGFSLFGLEIDGATIPPTESDGNYAVADSIQVGFRPFHLVSSLVRDRTLPITLTFIDPEVYGSQDDMGQWLRLDIQTAEEESPITIVLDQIQARNATVILAPYPQLLESPWENPGFFETATLAQSFSSLDLEASEDTDSGVEPDQDNQITALKHPVLLQKIDVNATLQDENRFAQFDIEIQQEDGGHVAIQGNADIEQQAVQAVIRTNNFQLSQFNSLVPIPGTITDGALDANLSIAYRPDRPLDLKGTAHARKIAAQLDVAPQTIANLDSRLRFDGQDIFVEDTSLNYGTIELTAAGNVNLETGYDLTAQIPSVTLENVKETVNLDIPFSADGAFAADIQIAGGLTNPIVSGVLRNIQPLQIDKIDFESIIAQFQLTAPILDVTDIAIIPAVGGLIAGSGQVNLEADGGVVFDMSLSDIPSDAFVQAYDITLPADYRVGLLNADVEIFGPYDDIQAVADWQLSNSSFPGQGKIRYTGNTVRIQNTQLAVEGGTVVADATVNLDRNRWQADVSASQVDIGRFSPQVQGILSSDITISGQIDNLSLEAIALAGQAQVANAEARLTSGSSPLLEPGIWNTQFRWTGTGIQVEQFTAPGVEADGFIATNLDAEPVIDNIDLNVSLRQYDLHRIEPLLPPSVQQQARLQGLVSFNGILNGTLANPQIIGDAQLDNLAFNAVEFNSALDGDLQFSLAEGGTIDLEGDGDRIFAQLDDRLLPTAFVIRNSNSVTDTTDPFTIEGQTQGETLTAEIRNFRLSELQFDPFPSQSIGRVRGVVNANIEANIADLSNPSVVGSVAIAQPAVGYIAAESFTGQLSYQSGRAALSQGELIWGTSRYRLSAQANVLDANLPYQADLVIEEGHVQDILTALQFFNFDDLNRGLEAPQYQGRSALVTRPVGVDPDASLLDQLAIISAIVTQREEAIAQQENALIPSLEELSGMFEGRISATGSRQTGFLVDFGLRGDNWAWGKFNQPNTFAASGTITPQTLTVAPFRFESGETFINFDGQVGRTQQSGMLEVANVPVEIIQEFVALPVDLEGNIYANAQIGGTLDDPEVVGDIGLIDSRLNETPLERVDVDFTYDDARLIANGGIFITGQDGMTIAGNIPYALPFMSIQPASDQISASIDIQNEGLAFLTILSNGQAIWDGGQGDIDLKASGTLTQPLIQGAVTFEDGAISSPLLNDPITGITGTANFNLDRINIDQLNAQFNDGQITVQGMLPIFNALAADPNTPLTITFKDTPVSLRNLLAAIVDGDVLITGAALAPVIGGNVNVSNGRVFALNLAGNTPTIPANDSPDAEPNPFLDQVQLEDFNISLSDSLQISGRPIFDIAAIGDLTLNGPLSDIKPDGTIQLTNGWINIVSTQFRLNRDADNTATFRPENGLDPDINVQLVARVQEVERTPIAPSSPFASAEVADQSTTPTFGGLQTVEVFATVDGLASKLSDNLELTSDPTRSDTQIVALLGGQTIDALQNGNVTGGVAAFVGSGFLAGFSNDLANTLGLSEFSIFPSTGDIGGESRLPLSIGIEVGFDITRDFSVSVLEILDGGSQPQFNFRYELTDQIRLRASTDLDEDSRAIIEFRSSF